MGLWSVSGQDKYPGAREIWTHVLVPLTGRSHTYRYYRLPSVRQPQTLPVTQSTGRGIPLKFVHHRRKWTESKDKPFRRGGTGSGLLPPEVLSQTRGTNREGGSHSRPPFRSQDSPPLSGHYGDRYTVGVKGSVRDTPTREFRPDPPSVPQRMVTSGTMTTSLYDPGPFDEESSKENQRCSG